MINKTERGDIFNTTAKHIAFSINAEGAVGGGFGVLLYIGTLVLAGIQRRFVDYQHHFHAGYFARGI
jgi:hypothetical protein